jgi:flagellar hook assembly protein FlgD
MKKLTILAVLLTVISAASFAEERKISETSKFKMVATSDVKYNFYYVAEEASDVCVTIYDANGMRVSSKTEKQIKSFRRTYDLSQLEPGKYTIEVRNKSGSADQEISHLIKVKKVRLKTFVSKIPDSKSVKLHVGDFDPNDIVLVKIYNQNNKLIHTEKINQVKGFSRVYNLNLRQLKSARISVENNGEKQSFTHYFR